MSKSKPYLSLKLLDKTVISMTLMSCWNRRVQRFADLGVKWRLNRVKVPRLVRKNAAAGEGHHPRLHGNFVISGLKYQALPNEWTMDCKESILISTSRNSLNKHSWAPIPIPIPSPSPSPAPSPTTFITNRTEKINQLQRNWWYCLGCSPRKWYGAYSTNRHLHGWLQSSLWHCVQPRVVVVFVWKRQRIVHFSLCSVWFCKSFHLWGGQLHGIHNSMTCCLWFVKEQ